MPISLSAHVFHISCGFLLARCPRAQSSRLAPRLASRPDGRVGRLRCPCLLASLLSCCRSLRLAASACLAWRRGVVRRMKKADEGVFGDIRIASLALRTFLPYLIRLVSACLVCSRPAPRAVWRGVMLRFVRLAFSLSLRRRACGSSPAPPARLRLLLASPGFPIVMDPRIALPPRSSLLPAHRPADRVEQAGRHRLACLPLSCGEVLLRSASLPLSCGVSLLAWLGAVLAYLNAFLGNFLKTCLGNLLKICLGNSLNTAKHVPISICPPRLSAVLSLCVAAYRLAVLSFSFMI